MSTPWDNFLRLASWYSPSTVCSSCFPDLGKWSFEYSCWRDALIIFESFVTFLRLDFNINQSIVIWVDGSKVGDLSLNFFWEDVVQDVNHFIPKLCLLVFEISGHWTRAVFRNIWIADVLEVDIRSSITDLIRIDLDVALGDLNFLWVQDVKYCQWVVNGGEREFVRFIVHLLKTLQHAEDGLWEWNRLVIFKMVHHLLRDHILMSHFQGNHHQRDVLLQSQHFLERVGVKIYIELSSRSDVALAHRSSHHHDLIKFLN